MTTLTFFKKPVLRFALLLPFCLCVGQLTAEEAKAGETADHEASAPTGPTVKFKILPVPTPANPVRSIKIVGAGGNPSNNSARPERVCHGGKSAPCETKINYRWLNPASSSDDDKVLTIKYKDGVYWDSNGDLQQVNPELCFDGLTQEGALTLDGSTATPGSPNVDATITLKTSDSRCFGKVFFFYDVKCSLKNGNSCPRIEDLDPGTLIDNGRNAILEGN